MSGRSPGIQEEPKGWPEISPIRVLTRRLHLAIIVQDHGLRDLDRRAYFGMFLFGLFNAVTASMRALCSATQLPRVQRLFGLKGPEQRAIRLHIKLRLADLQAARFQRPGMKEEVILVTSEPHGERSAVEVIELYRHRWQVEMFFRWLKCLVPCRHWLAEWHRAPGTGHRAPAPRHFPETSAAGSSVWGNGGR